MKSILLFLLLALSTAACDPAVKPEPDDPQPDNPKLDDSYVPVSIKSAVDAVQPSTGLVLWSDNARSRHSKYGESIALEYAYCLPCKVVKGKVRRLKSATTL